MDDQDNEIIPTQHFENFKAQALKNLPKYDYKAVSIDEVINLLKHLTPEQRQQLHPVLSKYTGLFDGALGHYPNYLAHVGLVPNASMTLEANSLAGSL